MFEAAASDGKPYFTQILVKKWPFLVNFHQNSSKILHFCAEQHEFTILENSQILAR
jgi:hypothetical protein